MSDSPVEDDPDRLGTDACVVYAADRFAGVFRRLAVLLIDAGVLIVVWMGLYMGLCATRFPAQHLEETVIQEFALLAWIYLAVLKPSRFRTPGYWVTGLRIVTLRGERPSVFRMTFRLLLSLFGPFSIWFDLPWIASDPWKQSLRDKMAGTYVIRQSADPIGKGVRRASYYGFLGYQLACWEVRPTSLGGH